MAVAVAVADELTDEARGGGERLSAAAACRCAAYCGDLPLPHLRSFFTAALALTRRATMSGSGAAPPSFATAFGLPWPSGNMLMAVCRSTEAQKSATFRVPIAGKGCCKLANAGSFVLCARAAATRRVGAYSRVPHLGTGAAYRVC